MVPAIETIVGQEHRTMELLGMLIMTMKHQIEHALKLKIILDVKTRNLHEHKIDGKPVVKFQTARLRSVIGAALFARPAATRDPKHAAIDCCHYSC